MNLSGGFLCMILINDLFVCCIRNVVLEFDTIDGKLDISPYKADKTDGHFCTKGVRFINSSVVENIEIQNNFRRFFFLFLFSFLFLSTIYPL